MKVIGVLLLLVGGGSGMLALGEFGRFSSLESSGNPFSGTALNSAVYLAGIAAIGVLAGIGFLIAPSGKPATAVTPTAGGPDPYAGMTWSRKTGWVKDPEAQPAPVVDPPAST